MKAAKGDKKAAPKPKQQKKEVDEKTRIKNLNESLEMLERLSRLLSAARQRQQDAKKQELLEEGQDVFVIRKKGSEYVVKAALEPADLGPVIEAIGALTGTIQEKLEENKQRPELKKISAMAKVFADAHKTMTEEEFDVFVSEMKAHADKLRGGQ